VKDNIDPLVKELCILCTLQEMRIEVGSHYCVCSWLMILMNIQFSQHYTVHELKLLWLVDRGVLETVRQNK
jgi:hypothetical protein